MKQNKNYRSIRIGKRLINENSPVFIIAEAGVNHNGSLKLAKKLIDVAKAAGADAVKFQTFIARQVMTEYAPKAKYQLKTTGSKQTQLAMAQSFELSFADFVLLNKYARSKGIVFLSTPFDLASARFLLDLKLPAVKISSGEITNYELLDLLNKARRPLIMSTGMSTIAEIKSARRQVKDCPVILLHCISNYPAAFQDVNLNSIKTMQKKFGNLIGYSDHTKGYEVAAAAVAIGARVIEKHFTLDNGLPGPDHRASLEPAELAQLVQAVRHVEAAMGDGVKKPRQSELEVMRIARKSIIVEKDLPAGTRLTSSLVAVKRPGTGIEPRYLKKIIGRRINRPLKKDHVLKWSNLYGA